MDPPGSMRLIETSRTLSAVVSRLTFGPPVAAVYNPLEYARRPHEQYLIRYGHARGRVLLLGMNPGPFGMAQTGVPFGDVAMVRAFLGIDAPVDRPPLEHPDRPVLGFACPRAEVSGTRLWGWARARFGSPEAFFREFFVANYCPLVFMDASGRNRTPDKLPAHERQPLFAACDEALRRIAVHLEPRAVVGVGGFAEQRARTALAGAGIPIGGMLHPSPASPRANRDWAGQADADLLALGVEAAGLG